MNESLYVYSCYQSRHVSQREQRDSGVLILSATLVDDSTVSRLVYSKYCTVLSFLGIATSVCLIPSCSALQDHELPFVSLTGDPRPVDRHKYAITPFNILFS